MAYFDLLFSNQLTHNTDMIFKVTLVIITLVSGHMLLNCLSSQQIPENASSRRDTRVAREGVTMTRVQGHNWAVAVSQVQSQRGTGQAPALTNKHPKFGLECWAGALRAGKIVN